MREGAARAGTRYSAALQAIVAPSAVEPQPAPLRQYAQASVSCRRNRWWWWVWGGRGRGGGGGSIWILAILLHSGFDLQYRIMSYTYNIAGHATMS